MEIRQVLIDELLSCKWLQNCGEQQNVEYDFDVAFQTDCSEVIKAINSIEWENICLEGSGNITEYLAVHNKEEYNKNWNQIVKKIKLEVLPQIIDKIQEVVAIKCLPEIVIDDIKFNLVTILACDAYSKYYTSEFCSRLFKIYTSGHLPCGWEGEYPSGKIIVF